MSEQFNFFPRNLILPVFSSSSFIPIMIGITIMLITSFFFQFTLNVLIQLFRLSQFSSTFCFHGNIYYCLSCFVLGFFSLVFLSFYFLVTFYCNQLHKHSTATKKHCWSAIKNIPSTRLELGKPVNIRQLLSRIKKKSSYFLPESIGVNVLDIPSW